MSSAYTHSAPYPRNSTDIHESLAHTRNFSSLSNATLFTSSSHSQPTDPLLQHTLESTPTENYYDRIITQPRNDPVTPRLRWNEPLAYSASQAPISEKPGYLCNSRKIQRSLKIVRFSMEFIVGIWTTYSAVRYFLALLRYNDPVGQIFCLALGTSAGVASVLTHCSILLSTFNGRILFQDDETFFVIQALLRTISSFCLLGPAVVNWALVFLWKNSQNPDFDLRVRCRYDVDAVWSVKRNGCDKFLLSWTPWVLLSSFRLAMTILIIILYQKLFWLHDHSKRNTHRHVHAESYDVTSLGDRQPSESTLIGESPSRQQTRVRLIRPRSSEIPVKDSSAEQASFGRPILSESVEFADRFRSLILQITQETEDAVAIARSDGTSSPETAEEHTFPQIFPKTVTNKYDEDYDNFLYNSRRKDDGNIFNLPSLPPTLGYNEFGLPYPPVSNVRVLNGFIRKMPTIESIGSWEVTSSLDPSNHGHNHNGAGSNHSISRRTTSSTVTTTDFSGSSRASRANSLCVHPEMSAGLPRLSPVSATSEQGELLGRSSGQRLSASSAEYPYVATSSITHETRSSNGSRNTTSSYRTAAMGGAHPSAVYHDGVPVQLNDV